ncbi:unnamed protein product [Lymnaea stagnalis]|uniref:Alpha/beta hydrolase fold-5 domain-containing protein n=1 Tax=Lymnaea stagnalis TaxID=6523 RepID=A0AAV2IKH9_LYMST
MRTLTLVAILMAQFTGSCSVTSRIIPPTRIEGDEAAVIFIPGANIKGEAYLDTAVAIQKASQLRLWVALTGNYSLNTPNPIELPTAVVDAISALQKAGMKGGNYTGIAHSLGGVFLAPSAATLQLKAVILLGSYLSRSKALSAYPLPLLTLSGELDGQARISRIALEYEQLQNEVKRSPEAVYRIPVINIPGVSHAQFASGPMPPAVTKYDLKPEVSEDVAHALIGAHVSNFLTVTFNSPTAAAVRDAKAALDKSFTDSGTRFQPLLNIKGLDSDGQSSPWAVSSQEFIAGDLVERTKTENKIDSEAVFLSSKPSLVRSGNDVTIKTTTFLKYETNTLDISTIPESPKEVDIKFKSYEAIQEALGLGPQKALKLGPKEALKRGPHESVGHNATSCRLLNELAFGAAFSNSTSQAQERYKAHGRPILFEDDVVYSNGFTWTNTPLKMTEDDAGLHVQSIALNIPVHSIIYPGNFYCKLLSPYRAMEWINVDSLRAHKPSRSFWSLLGLLNS